MLNRLQNGTVLTIGPFETINYEVAKVVSTSFRSILIGQKCLKNKSLTFPVDTESAFIFDGFDQFCPIDDDQREIGLILFLRMHLIYVIHIFHCFLKNKWNVHKYNANFPAILKPVQTLVGLLLVPMANLNQNALYREWRINYECFEYIYAIWFY